MQILLVLSSSRILVNRLIFSLFLLLFLQGCTEQKYSAPIEYSVKESASYDIEDNKLKPMKDRIEKHKISAPKKHGKKVSFELRDDVNRDKYNEIYDEALDDREIRKVNAPLNNSKSTSNKVNDHNIKPNKNIIKSQIVESKTSERNKVSKAQKIDPIQEKLTEEEFLSDIPEGEIVVEPVVMKSAGEKNLNSSRIYKDQIKNDNLDDNTASDVSDYIPDDKNGMTFSLPAKGSIINRFGEKVNGKKILGINILTHDYAQIHSTQKGEVVYTGTDKEFGNIVIIKHNNLLFAYAKLSDIHVRKGDRVSKNQTIGSVGNSKLLHIAIQDAVSKKSIDPEKYLEYND